MIKFDKEELLKLANLSGLKLDNQEIPVLVEQIKLVLNYTNELDIVKLAQETAPIKNVNVFREDIIKKFDSSSLIKQAPKSKDNYFVVPRILK